MNDGGPKYMQTIASWRGDEMSLPTPSGQTRHQSLAETAMASMLNAIDAQVYQMAHITAVAKVAHLVADAMLAEEARRAKTAEAGDEPVAAEVEQPTPDLAMMLSELLEWAHATEPRASAKRLVQNPERLFLEELERRGRYGWPEGTETKLESIYHEVFR